MSGTRSVVSFDRRLRAHRTREAVALTPRSPESRTRSRRPLSSTRLTSRSTADRHLGDTGTRSLSQRVRAIVTRSAGGPTHAFRRERDRRNRDAYDRLLPNPSNQSGTLICAVSASTPLPVRVECEPVRTAFHDAVARFGGPGSRSDGRFLPAESEMTRATSDTPVALRSSTLT
jgi:hypothetical protein